MSKQNFGVVGMGVMGSNIALNIESRGYSVSIFNRTEDATQEVISQHPEKNLVATYSVEEFVESLQTPRKILLMIKAGQPTDATIEALLPHLQAGDILIDGGNTYFEDTIRRNQFLADSGIHFIGCGISGGEEGARKGPSMMPGGQKEAYDLVAEILKEISAKAQDGQPCVTYIGADGAGHYVKMVHNGIEYGDMQLIAETYDIMHRGLGLSTVEIGNVFQRWNNGKLKSFLIEITAQILQTIDPDTQQPLVEKIMDKAGNKGTGKWTSQSSLDLGEPLSLITESVFARFISALKEERIAASKVIPNIDSQLNLKDEERESFIQELENALFFSKIMSYAQGFSQLKAASKEYDWDLPYGEIASIWREGCIIRAEFLQNITNAYEQNPQLDNLMLDPYFLDIISHSHQSVRHILVKAIQAGIPTPTFSAAIAYYDAYRSETLPANIIQAQRDFFGAHTYERTDKEGSFHFDWQAKTQNRV